LAQENKKSHTKRI